MTTKNDYEAARDAFANKWYAIKGHSNDTRQACIESADFGRAYSDKQYIPVIEDFKRIYGIQTAAIEKHEAEIEILKQDRDFHLDVSGTNLEFAKNTAIENIELNTKLQSRDEIISTLEAALIRLKYNRDLEIEATETGGVPHQFENIAEQALDALGKFRSKE